MRTITRVLVALCAAFAGLFVGTGTAHAGLDNELSLVDGQGRTMDIQQWDTFLNGVYPLDKNRLTREWFHSGRAIYHVTGRGLGSIRRHPGAGLSDRLPLVAGGRGELQLHHPQHQPGPDLVLGEPGGARTWW